MLNSASARPVVAATAAIALPQNSPPEQSNFTNLIYSQPCALDTLKYESVGIHRSRLTQNQVGSPGFCSNTITDSLVKAEQKVAPFPGRH